MIWQETVSGGYTAVNQETGWCYLISYNVGRGDWAISAGVDKLSQLCNFVGTPEEAKEVCVLHWKNEEAPKGIGCGPYKGWNFPHNVWIGHDSLTDPWAARNEIDWVVREICFSRDIKRPNSPKWEDIRDKWAKEKVEVLINSLNSSDSNEYLGADAALREAARMALAQWEKENANA